MRGLRFGPGLPIYGRIVIMRIARVSSYAKKNNKSMLADKTYGSLACKSSSYFVSGVKVILFIYLFIFSRKNIKRRLKPLIIFFSSQVNNFHGYSVQSFRIYRGRAWKKQITCGGVRPFLFSCFIAQGRRHGCAQRVNTRANSTNFYPVFFFLHFSNIFILSNAFAFPPPPPPQ